VLATGRRGAALAVLNADATGMARSGAGAVASRSKSSTNSYAFTGLTAARGDLVGDFGGGWATFSGGG